MWYLLSALARAADADAPMEQSPTLTLEDLPWQIQDEGKWTMVHLHATRVARAGGWVSIVSAGMTGAGALMLVLADQSSSNALYPGGGTLVGVGVVGGL